jgi:hypothetical protein
MFIRASAMQLADLRQQEAGTLVNRVMRHIDFVNERRHNLFSIRNDNLILSPLSKVANWTFGQVSNFTDFMKSAKNFQIFAVGYEYVK